jgi:rhodanese-related sulfurtransferase
MSAARKRRTKKTIKRSVHPSWMGIAFAIAGVIIIGLVAFSILTKPSSPAAANIAGVISVEEAFDKYQAGGHLLDVRTSDEWEEYHIPDTNFIPLEELTQRINEVPKDVSIVVVCRTGNRSQAGRDLLIDAGYTQVVSMAGGLQSWRNMGYPIVEGVQ